eukprot:10042074-Alexandrium_andersonii.AAC.1
MRECEHAQARPGDSSVRGHNCESMRAARAARRQACMLALAPASALHARAPGAVLSEASVAT